MAEPVVAGLAIRDDQTTFDDNQLRALRELHPDLYGTSAAQVQVFFHCCRVSGLDPFANQIYMIQRGAGNDRRWTVQTGIGGYRLIARRAVDRAKEDLSYEDTVWFDQDGTEYNVWLRKEPPAACRVIVWRGESRFPAVVHWTEFAPLVWDYELEERGVDPHWKKMPANQIRKVAEAHALRMACPQDLSGIYVDEEMHAADADAAHAEVQAKAAQLKAEATTTVPGPTDTETGPGAAPQKQSVDELADARTAVKGAAEARDLDFEAINELCFEKFSNSFQDATVEQLQQLTAIILEPAGTPPDTAGETTPAAPSKRAPRKAATTRKSAVKTAARKAAPAAKASGAVPEAKKAPARKRTPKAAATPAKAPATPAN